jgi:hypothetical protein
MVIAPQPAIGVTSNGLSLQLADGEPLTLAAAIERANPLLGPFGVPPDLSFALAAHLDWLERSGRVQRLHREGVVAWQAL